MMKSRPFKQFKCTLATVAISLFFVNGEIGFAQESNDGREVLRQAVEAAGGIDAFKGVSNFTIKTQSEIIGNQTKTQLNVTETIQLPDKTKQVMELKGGMRIQVLNGSRSWKQIGKEKSGLSALEQREMERGLFRDMVILFSKLDDPALTVSYVDLQTLGGQSFHVLRIKNGQGDFFNLFVNADTFLVYKKVYQGAAEAGLATLEEIYSDYQEVDGIKIPFHTIVKANGRQFIESLVLEASVNGPLDDEFFYR